MTREAGAGGQLWLHQAEALGALDRGENVVVATATASGKSMVFQAWTLHGIKASSEPTSEPTTLVFYPTKVLANDQERRWLEACELVGHGHRRRLRHHRDLHAHREPRRNPACGRTAAYQTPNITTTGCRIRWLTVLAQLRISGCGKIATALCQVQFTHNNQLAS